MSKTKKELLLPVPEPKEKQAPHPWLTPWEKGKSGNPNGRPKGSRGKAKELAEALIGTNATNIVKKVITMALEGNETCLKMCMDRILPTQRAVDTSNSDKMGSAINIFVESAKQVIEHKKEAIKSDKEALVIDVTPSEVNETKENVH